MDKISSQVPLDLHPALESLQASLKEHRRANNPDAGDLEDDTDDTLAHVGSLTDLLKSKLDGPQVRYILIACSPVDPICSPLPSLE